MRAVSLLANQSQLHVSRSALGILPWPCPCRMGSKVCLLQLAREQGLCCLQELQQQVADEVYRAVSAVPAWLSIPRQAA